MAQPAFANQMFPNAIDDRCWQCRECRSCHYLVLRTQLRSDMLMNFSDHHDDVDHVMFLLF